MSFLTQVTCSYHYLDQLQFLSEDLGFFDILRNLIYQKIVLVSLKLEQKGIEVSVHGITNTNILTSNKISSYQILLALMKGINHKQSSENKQSSYVNYLFSPNLNIIWVSFLGVGFEGGLPSCLKLVRIKLKPSNLARKYTNRIYLQKIFFSVSRLS